MRPWSYWVKVIFGKIRTKSLMGNYSLLNGGNDVPGGARQQAASLSSDVRVSADGKL